MRNRHLPRKRGRRAVALQVEIAAVPADADAGSELSDPFRYEKGLPHGRPFPFPTCASDPNIPDIRQVVVR